MNRRTFLATAASALVLTGASAGTTLADTTLASQQMVGVMFDEIERAIIEAYFGRGSNFGLPPGLAKRDQLPPGLQRQIERNGTLPPGLATYDLPVDLLDRLPPATPGTRRVVVGNDVILIREGTRYILDVIKDVLTS